MSMGLINQYFTILINYKNSQVHKLRDFVQNSITKIKQNKFFKFFLITKQYFFIFLLFCLYN